MLPYAHPQGGKNFFAYIALAAYKSVTKLESNTNHPVIATRKLATKSLSISNCVVAIYKHLKDSF